MTARIWRGWASVDSVDEIEAYLREGPLARFCSIPGYVSASVLLRSMAGGVELMTISVWDSADAVPAGVDENHPLLVARQTVPDCFELVDVASSIAQAA